MTDSNDMKDNEKDLKKTAADGTGVPGENTDKTTPDSPVPESVADETPGESASAGGTKTQGDKEHDRDKSKRKYESEIKRLGSELDKLNGLLDGEKERYIRLYAEYDNYRKRTAAEKQSVYAEAYAESLKEILPVYDSLERALTAAGETADAAKLIEGVKLTLNSFSEALTKLGIEEFGKPGDKFDPALHNAVMHEENDENGEGEITAVFQRGFKRGDRVLRFAMVKVAN